MKKSPKLTFVVFIVVSALTGLGIWANANQSKISSFLNLTANDSPETRNLKPALKQLASSSSEEINKGNQLIRQARLALLEQTRSFQADILQIIQTPETSFRATGTYHFVSDLRSRFEIEMEIKGINGKFVQVSNGQVVWNIRELNNLKQIRPTQQEEDFTGQEVKIERVDLSRLFDFAQEKNIPINNSHFSREFSTGLPGLLAALESEMDFKVLKQVNLKSIPHYVLQGEWKAASGQREFEDTFAAQIFSGEAPERIRLYLRANDLMPVRYLCLKKRPDGNGWYAPLAMELSNILVNGKINDELFHFRPGSDHIPKDVTHEYLARLEKALLIAPDENEITR